MYQLIRDNVVKITDSEAKRDKMLTQGYIIYEPPEDTKAEEIPKEEEEPECSQSELTAILPSETPTSTSEDTFEQEILTENAGKTLRRKTKKTVSE